MKNIKWLISHQPEHLFLRTAKAFAKILEEVNSEYKIEILTTGQYKAQYDADFTRDKIWGLVQSGEIQMSQTEVAKLAIPTNDDNFYVFDMPWLFESHAHARRVLEGPIGKAMNDRLAKQTGVRGLAYTYSGGYRTIGSDLPFKKLADLKGYNIKSNSNPITQEFWKSLGVNTVKRKGPVTELVSELQSHMDCKDTTYIRLPQAKNWINTKHSLFLTDILISDSFFKSLSEKEQVLFVEAANKAARLERKWSQDDADSYEATAKENGTTIHTLSEEDIAEMRAKAQPLYEKWSSKFFPGLIDGIKKLS
jgi:TRAP-type C4-dicarboxylate transport system substrate-binding protein